MIKTGKKGRTWVWGVATGLLAIFTLVAITGSSRSDNNNYAPTLTRRSGKTKTLITGGITPAAMPTKSSLATPVLMQQETVTPLPTQTPRNSKVFIPVIEKEGNPLSFQSRLPLMIKADITSLPSPPPEVAFKEKTILVDISNQHVYAYDRGKLIFSFVASTGRHNLTRAGKYKILDKTPNAYSDPWGFWMPYWMGIYYAGYNLENGFHSLPVLSNGVKIWGNKIGSPVTYGCVVLMPDDMRKLYRWAGIGTAVVIQK